MHMTYNYWDTVLDSEYHKEYFANIVKFVNKVYKEKTIFPPKARILSALDITDYNDVKVVILGQDPYHGIGEANGLAFSVNDGVKIPPSLKNIYKELHDDLGIEIPNTGNLESWAKEGVLLLNSVLTVEKDKPASHKNIGWETFTDSIIKKLNERDKPIVFILWGNFAKSKKELIIVEGITSKLRVDCELKLYKQDNLKCVCTFGKKITDTQIIKIKTIIYLFFYSFYNSFFKV
mgnify:CR=1 FL=1